MKWENKGHELDDFGKKLVQIFHDKQKKYMFLEQGFWAENLFLYWKNINVLQATLIMTYINRLQG